MLILIFRAVSESVLDDEARVAEVVPLETDRIVSAVALRLNSSAERLPNGFRTAFGDGRAGARSVCFIAEYLSLARPTAACEESGSDGGEYRQEADGGAHPSVPRLVDSRSLDATMKTLREMSSSDNLVSLFGKRFLKERISVILTQYKRNTTESQLRAIFRQTAIDRIDRIVVVQNEAHVDLSFLDLIDFSGDVLFGGSEFLSRIPGIIQVVKSAQWNTKYYGRFALALLFDSEFCAVFDDDTIPQPRFLEAATALSEKRNVIVGSSAVIVLPQRSYYVNPAVGSDLEVLTRIIRVLFRLLVMCSHYYPIIFPRSTMSATLGFSRRSGSGTCGQTIFRRGI